MGRRWPALVVCAAALGCAGCGDKDSQEDPALVAEGLEVFRNETFGDEVFWTDTLRIHEAIASTVDPTTALGVGLKVDSEKLPAGILQTADLTSPATTVALLKLGAVVGLRGTVTTDASGDHLTRVGITCALCHSTVDNSVAPGIGRRLDGYANRDLDPGAIIALSPALSDAQKDVYRSWGPGRYDPRYNIDGQNGPVLIPPAYGLLGSPHATYTGDGDIRYWNAYVAITQMGGQGNFTEARLGIERRVPAGGSDLVTPRLEALRAYQVSLAAPKPPAGSFDASAAERGRAVFEGAGRCSACHQGAVRTQSELHPPSETGMEASYAERGASKRYRATPLRALWQHAPYFHDGSARTLEAVVRRYESALGLHLTDGQRADLLEYLKSI